MLNSTVRIAGITTESVVDGPGLRSTVFFQGCPHACEGCHNPETWNPDGGQEVTLRDLLTKLKLNPLIAGVTFSGGEPFYQASVAAELGRLLQEQGFNLWVYTGYTWEYLLDNISYSGFSTLLKVTDVLVDSPFQKQDKALQLPFKGSSNQRIIKVSESLKAGAIIQWRADNNYNQSMSWFCKEHAGLKKYQLTAFNDHNVIQGYSSRDYGNMALHTGDRRVQVIKNRKRFLTSMELKLEI